jgi:phosphohistidine phosphatase
MRLTILRHAVAVEADEWDGEDATRPLTKGGINRVTLLLKKARGLVRADQVWTSPWVRARATAELAASILKLPLREQEWLAGGAATAKERTAQLSGDADLLLVGHEPDLGQLIGHLCGCRGVELAKGGMAFLKGEPVADGMALRGLITTKMVAELLGIDG